MSHFQRTLARGPKKSALIFVLSCLIVSIMVSACASGANAAPASGQQPEAQSTEVAANTESPASTAVETSPEKVTLELWDITESESYDAWWEDFLKQYQADHPEVTIHKTSFDTVTYDDKLLAAMSVGNPPDIFYNIAGESVAKYVRTGKVAALDGMIDESVWSQGLLNGLKWDGKLYGVPIAPYTLVLWYNKGVFSDLNLTPPATWDELIGDCATIKKAGIVPIALGNQAKWPFMIYFEYLLYAYGGPDILSNATFGADGKSWKDEAFLKAADKTVELINSGCFPDSFNGFDHSNANGLFFNDQAAMDLMGSWLPGVAKADAPAGFEMGFLYFPTPSDAEFSMGEGGGLNVGLDMFSVSADSPNKQAAVDLLNEFGKQAGKFSAAAGNIPAVKDATVEDPMMADLAEAVTGASFVFGSGDRILPAPVVDPYLNNLQALSLGDLSPQQFVDEMTATIDREKANFNK